MEKCNWSTKKSADAQERQASAMEELTHQIQQRIGLWQESHSAEADRPAGEVDASLLQIPTDPLGD
jgi:hypothetical protein